jgi:hypothetical protein
MSKFMTAAAVAALLSMGAAAHAATAPKSTAPTKPSPTTSAPPTDTAPPPASTPTPDTGATPPATTDQTPASPSTPSAATGTATDTAAVVTVGLPVKNNTGAQIGQVTALNKDSSGKEMASIQMGTDTFSVDSSRLAVANGAATINLTQQQITDMLHKSAAPK